MKTTLIKTCVDMPDSNITVSSAESCSSDVVKHLKVRERTASIASSINSSETSDPLSGDDIESPDDADEKEEEPKWVVGDIDSAETTTTRSFKMQTHLRGMQRRLEILQRLVQEAAQESALRLRLKGAAMQVKPCLVSAAIMEENRDKDQLADLQALAPEERVSECLELTSTSPSISVEKTQNDAVDDSKDEPQTCSSLTSSSEEGLSAITTLLDRIKALQAQLKKATDDNQQLQSIVHKLEQENARLHAQTVFCPSLRSEDDSKSASSERVFELNSAVGYDIGDKSARSISRLEPAVFGASSAFQIVMEEDLENLKDHERCQQKLHELWDIVRQLKMLVETYDIERNAMKSQRDDAIAEAERADVENIRLASSNNVQQKIKYLQQVKKDNQALRRKNRELNVRIVKEAVRLVREKNGCSLHEDGDFPIETVDSALLDDPLQEFDESSMRISEKILRSMRDFCRLLEQRLERLRLARQSVPQDNDDDSFGDRIVLSH